MRLGFAIHPSPKLLVHYWHSVPPYKASKHPSLITVQLLCNRSPSAPQPTAGGSSLCRVQRLGAPKPCSLLTCHPPASVRCCMHLLIPTPRHDAPCRAPHSQASWLASASRYTPLHAIHHSICSKRTTCLAHSKNLQGAGGRSQANTVQLPQHTSGVCA